jgi:DNA-binding NarL/FixJ family response regulator
MIATKHLRILVADDQPQIRRAVRVLIEASRPEWEIIAEAADGREAIAKAEELHPDVIIMDISMPNLNGLEATKTIHQTFPSISILILTSHDIPSLPVAARDAGAKGLVVKSDSSRFLIPAVQTVSDCHTFFSRTPGN